MKIGLLAYHAACNFGAFLQLLSTVEYIKKHGDEPVVINWVPRDFRRYYEKRSKNEIRELYSSLRNKYYPLSTLCETAKEVAELIEHEHIDAVIVGSDAVIQHHPFRERFKFPCRRIIYIGHPTSDRMYPNCFWGEFNKFLKRPVPVAVISGSSQDSKYYYISGRTKRNMKESICAFKYISVRDDWSQKMIEYLTDGEVRPVVTPDPVFAFNSNAGSLVPSKEEILAKYNIPRNYLILSFRGANSVSQSWINRFQVFANQDGLSCIKLPYADFAAFGDIEYSVGDSISPLDWYALIKYSKGYVGNNMHPIVSSIANGVPFFSFDNYGIPKQNGKPTNGESSKIFHILDKSGLLRYRTYALGIAYKEPDAEFVYNELKSFNVAHECKFAKEYFREYEQMMRDVITSLKQ